MAEEDRWSTRSYDFAKGAVLLVLLLLLAIALVLTPNAAPDQQEPLPVGVAQDQQQPLPAGAAQSQQQPPPVSAAPVWDPPRTAADGSVSLSGSAEPGSTVELWAGEVMLATVPVDSDGSWSYAGQLDPGDYQIVARTVSVEGLVLNESEAVAVSVSGTRTAAVDVSEPQVDASGQITLSGTGEPGSTLDILDNGVVVASAVVGEDGAWTVHYAASAGEHTLAVQIQGQTGEGSTAARVAVAVPATAAMPTATAVPTTAAAAATAGGHSYVVQPGDWLMKLARRYFGDPNRWIDIYEATNAKAASDPSYHKLASPGYLLPGWKIWIPEP